MLEIRSWYIPEIRTRRNLAGATRACLGIASGRDSKVPVSSGLPPFSVILAFDQKQPLLTHN